MRIEPAHLSHLQKLAVAGCTACWLHVCISPNCVSLLMLFGHVCVLCRNGMHWCAAAMHLTMLPTAKQVHCTARW